MPFSKASKVFTSITIFFILYSSLLYDVIPLPPSFDIFKEDVLSVLPFWILVTFGAYSLGNIGYSLFTFRDCKGAYIELMEEIQMAKDDLRKYKIFVD